MVVCGWRFILLAMAHHVPVSVDDSHDPLTRMRAHQIAESLIEDAFADAAKLKAEIITVKIASQLYAAICGIEASIGTRLTQLTQPSSLWAGVVNI